MGTDSGRNYRAQASKRNAALFSQCSDEGTLYQTMIVAEHRSKLRRIGIEMASGPVHVDLAQSLHAESDPRQRPERRFHPETKRVYDDLDPKTALRRTVDEYLVLIEGLGWPAEPERTVLTDLRDFAADFDAGTVAWSSAS